MWTVVMGEQLLCERKPGLNVVDRYAMVVKKDSCIAVGQKNSQLQAANDNSSDLVQAHQRTIDCTNIRRC